MKFKVVLYETNEGFAVGCPSLPGCWSQGETRDEALENIQIGIREFMDVLYEELVRDVAKDMAENDDLSVSLAEVEVDIENAEDFSVSIAKV